MSIVAHSYYLKTERHKFIDQQVREAASVLVDSEKLELRKIDFQKIDELISKELGESRIGKFFIIRDQNDEIVFENVIAKVLPKAELNKKGQWISFYTKDKYVRALNLMLPKFPGTTLQVGLILDKKIANPGLFSKNSWIIISLILFIGLTFSWLLTSYLLAPIKKLELFLARASSKIKKQEELELFKNNANISSNDEFHRMIISLNLLIERINKNYKISRLWAYQMAHELKTPLSILTLEIEQMQKNAKISTQEFAALNLECKKISDVMSSFLGWAELENSGTPSSLFANKLGAMAQEAITRLGKDNNDRIILVIKQDPIIIANTQHLDQLIINLITNSLNYSPKSTQVKIEIDTNKLIISDKGEGISQKVLHRLGDPFNKGEIKNRKSIGHGLGLAWVNSICLRYDWKLIFTYNAGTVVTIEFPSNEK